MSFSVGQELFWVNSSNRHAVNHVVTVIKVGRKWAELSNYNRVDMATGWADGRGYSPSGRIYISEAVYVAEQLINEVFSNLKDRMGWTPKKGVTLENIKEAARLLGISLEAA